MHPLNRMTKPVVYTVVASLLLLGAYAPAHATLIATDTIVEAAHAQHNRDRVRAMIERDAVKQQLIANGVDPQQVRDRLDALNDQEVNAMAEKMDQLPAGGDAIGAVVLVFLVLLITDILGYTDVFPFVKK